MFCSPYNWTKFHESSWNTISCKACTVRQRVWNQPPRPSALVIQLRGGSKVGTWASLFIAHVPTLLTNRTKELMHTRLMWTKERKSWLYPKFRRRGVAITTAKSMTGLLYHKLEYSATLELSSKPKKVKYKIFRRLFLTNVLTFRKS